MASYFSPSFVHFGIQYESPSVEYVKDRLKVSDIPEAQKELYILKGYPVWLFTIIK